MQIRLENIKIVAIKARIGIFLKTWLSESGRHGNGKFVWTQDTHAKMFQLNFRKSNKIKW